MQRTFITWKEVKANLNSALTEKDQIDNFLKERRLMRSLEKFRWWKIIRRDTYGCGQKNHMILSYDVLINQDIFKPMIHPEPEGSTQGYPLVSVEVLSHGPSDVMHNPLPATQSRKDFVSKLTEIHAILINLLTQSELVDIEKNILVIHKGISQMKMEILLEPTSNKLMVEHAEYDESNTYVLERFNTTAGNPVKKILLKLNLSDHRLFKDGGGVKEVQRSFRHSDTERLSRSDEVLKLKNFKKDATLKLSKSTNQERYEHVGPEVASPQDGKVTRWRRDCAWLMISRCSRSQCQIQVQGTSSIQKSMITTTYSQEKVKSTS
ncbi:hypothetical protein Tco_1517137 [Tanacetum coccineum]